MSKSVVISSRAVPGSRYEFLLQVTGDAAYPNTGTFATSGYPILPTDAGMIDKIERLGSAMGPQGYVGVIDPNTNNLHLFTGAGVELANGFNASAITVPVSGKGC